MRGPVLLLVSLLAVALPGCGEEAPPAADGLAAEGDGHAEPPLDAMTRARFALDRLTRGPLPGTPFPISNVHTKGLELARDDLLALPDQTLALLGDDDLLARLTAPRAQGFAAWQGVLSVLGVVPGKPFELVRRWTEPAIERDDIQLRRAALRCLVTVPDDAANPILHRFLARDPDDRIIAPLAFSTLCAVGGPWPRRAFDVAHRQGTGFLWSQATERAQRGVPAAETDPAIDDALTWWQALVEGSGPRLPATQPRWKRFGVARMGAWLDPALHRTAGPPLGGGDPSPREDLHPPMPPTRDGWLQADLGRARVVPAFAYLFTGKRPAADARCALARHGYGPYLAARQADLARRDEAPELYYTALHCDMRVEDPEHARAVMREVETLLGQAKLGLGVDQVRMRRLVGSLPPAEDPEVRALLFRLLRELPAQMGSQPVTETVHDRLAGERTLEVVASLRRMLDEGGVARGRALHLMLRSLEPAHLDALEAEVARSEPAEARRLWMRLVSFYARAPGVPPARVRAFVEDLARKLEREPESAVRGLASALLDFGEDGARHFAAGLGGPRRALYLQAWPRNRRLVPREVAEAALAPIGPDTSEAELRLVLDLAWHSFPPAAAPKLRALRARLPAARRPWVDYVLTHIRHRAPRR